MYSAPEDLLKAYWKWYEPELSTEFKGYDDFVDHAITQKPQFVEDISEHLYTDKYSKQDRAVFEKNAGVDKWRSDQPSWIEVVGAKTVKRGGELAGGAITTVDALAQWMEEKIPLGGIDFDTFEYVPPEELAERGGAGGLRAAGRGLAGALPDYGYEDKTSWEDFKASPAKKFFPFAMEHGLASLPDMAAAIVALPAYVMARTGEIADHRVLNNAVDISPEEALGAMEHATVEDLLYALPAAVASSALERIGAAKVFGLTDELRDTTVKEIGKAVARRAGGEAATEAVQEPVEQVGGAAGTERWRQMDAADISKELVEGAVQGAVVGLGFGGVVGAGTVGAQARARSKADAAAEGEAEAAPVLPPEINDAVEAQKGGRAKGGRCSGARRARHWKRLMRWRRRGQRPKATPSPRPKLRSTAPRPPSRGSRRRTPRPMPGWPRSRQGLRSWRAAPRQRRPPATPGETSSRIPSAQLRA